MSTTIVGLFDQTQVAESLRREIQARGIADRDIETLSWQGERGGSAGWGLDSKGATDVDRRESLTKHLRKWGVDDDDADDFAEAVRRGGLLVLTRVDDDKKVDTITTLMEQREAIDLDDRRAMWRKDSMGGQNMRGNGEIHRNKKMRGDKSKGRHMHGTDAAIDGAKNSGQPSKLQEAHEELHIGKKAVPVGKVRVHKRVEEEPVERDIELKSDKIEIERRPIDSNEKQAIDPDVFKDEVVEFTEFAEKPVVEKEVRLDDEFVAKRKVETHDETVSDTVRRTVVDIEPMTQGLSDKDSFDSLSPGYRQHFDKNYAALGDWEDYQDAYRYGHAFGASDQYGGGNWNDIEPDMRSSYEERHGQGSFGERSGAARHAFNSFRNRMRGSSNSPRK